MEIYSPHKRWDTYTVNLYTPPVASAGGSFLVRFPDHITYIWVLECERDCRIYATDSPYQPIAFLSRGDVGFWKLPNPVDSLNVAWDVGTYHPLSETPRPKLVFWASQAPISAYQHKEITPFSAFNTNSFSVTDVVQGVKNPFVNGGNYVLGPDNNWLPLGTPDSLTHQTETIPNGYPAAVSIVPVSLSGSAAFPSIVYSAIVRRTAQPWREQLIFAAAGRLPLLALWSPASRSLTTRILSIEAMIWSVSAPVSLMVDLVQITTVPTGGNTITAVGMNAFSPTSALVVKGVPSGGAAESSGQPWTSFPYSLGITGAGAATNPPHPGEWITLWNHEQAAGQSNGLELQAGVDNGIGVIVDVDAACTVGAFTRVRFVEG